MAFDRSKFKATKVADLKKQDKEVMSLNRKGDRTQYLSFDKGTNKIRIFPAHPDSKSFVYPYGRWWLMREVSYQKDGEDITEMKKLPVFNAKIHGGAKKDVVEEYVTFVTQLLSDEIDDQDELKNKLESLTHWRNGLRCKQEWACYIHKYVNGTKNFGLITFSNGVKNKLNEIAITEDDASSPITTDPFTDPDEGKAIIVTYDPSQKQAKDVYKAAIEFRGNYALTDKELEEFSKLDSLEKLFANVYRRRDFDLALEGLQHFDLENGFGAFEHDSWLDIVEELSEEWPEDDDNENTQDEEVVSEKTEAVKEKETQEEIEEEVDEFEAMTRLELKKFISKNKLGIVVKKQMSDDEIKEAIRSVYEADNTEVEKTNDAPEPKTSGLSKIDEIRAKLRAKK